MTSAKMDKIHLEDYFLTAKRGFLPQQDPLSASSAFPTLSQISKQLPKLLAARAVRTTIKDEIISPSELQQKCDMADYQYAARVLSFLAHAYVWEEPNKPAHSLPAQIALPWYTIMSQLARPPVLSYSSYALDNWKKINNDGSITLGNIELQQNFLGGMDEEWFILIHIEIEKHAGIILHAACQAIECVQYEKLAAVQQQLETMAAAIEQCCTTLARMPERCDPYVYFNRVRPYIHGWQDNPALPNGLIYEGVEQYQGKPKKFRGETGAQSTIIPCLDAVLGISHSDDPLVHYLKEMRSYMPENHRAFLQALESAKNEQGCQLVYGFVKKHKKQQPSLWDAFCQCINAVARFRTIHLEFAESYIHKQWQSNKANPTKIGTGGTPFMQYLQKHLDETKKVIVK